MGHSSYLLDDVGGYLSSQAVIYVDGIRWASNCPNTNNGCLSHSVSEYLHSPKYYTFLPQQVLAAGVHPLQKSSTLGIYFFRSICAAAICLSDCQSPVLINCLSSALRNSSGSHFPLPTSLSSSNDNYFSLFSLVASSFLCLGLTGFWRRCFALAMTLFLWG